MSMQMTGLRAWLVQRIAAVYIGFFSLYLLIHFTTNAPGSYLEWRDWVGHPGIAVSWALFFIALLLHAWVGMRDVLLDYVHNTAVRLVALLGLALFLLAQGLWALTVLLGAGT